MFGKIVTLSVITLIGLHLYGLYDQMDFAKEITNAGPRDCYAVPGIKYGSEDIQVIEQHNVAIISSGFVPKYPSNIFMVKLDKMDSLTAESFTFEPTTFDKATFHPHGIFVKMSSKGYYYLYVVNHHDGFECVDIFQIDLDNTKLIHIRRITDPLFRLLNDLVVVDDFKFYATNWMSGRNKLINFVQGLLMLPVGDVIYYNGNSAEVAVKNLFVPNGIDISSDKRHVFVGLSGSKAMALYYRNPDSTLTFMKQFPVGDVVDNVFFVDGSSELWFAGPYRMINSALRVFHVADVAVPSFASKFTFNADGELFNLQHMFIDDGNMVSAAASVVKVKGYLLLGTVDNQLFACKL